MDHITEIAAIEAAVIGANDEAILPTWLTWGFALLCAVIIVGGGLALLQSTAG